MFLSSPVLSGVDGVLRCSVWKILSKLSGVDLRGTGKHAGKMEVCDDILKKEAIS